ncbi:MAG: putative selenium-dependent hydroxylase accessory protein YqeC, partial [Caldilineae bacterium]
AGGKSTVLFRLAQEIVAAGARVVTTTTTRMFFAQTEQAPARILLPAGDTSENHLPWSELVETLAVHRHCLLAGPPVGDKVAGLAPETVDGLVDRAAELGLAAILVEADGARQRPVKAPAEYEPQLPTSTTHLIPVLGVDGVGARLDEPLVHRPERLRRLLGVEDPDARLTPEMAARLLLHPQGGAKGCTADMQFMPLLNKADPPPRLAAARIAARILASRQQAACITAVGRPRGEPVLERWGPTAAVVLAGGASRRMGRLKQLLRLDDEPLVVRAARLALESDPDQVLVVTGASGDRIAEALQGLRNTVGPRLQLVHNPAWTGGQSTSVTAAVNALSPETQAALFLPVDQPLLPVALLRRLWCAWRQGGDLVAVSVDGVVRGAPAVFDRRFFHALTRLEGDRGARNLLRTHRGEIHTVSAQAAWLQDVDTPEDWRGLQG